ncbi:MAG: HlyC/CorC family transporter [Bacteroidetes bacterium]|jgi:CBS domain containing-hemolysin-like protein|nr:HlyC/CorC family transporter [Bacteroidota bacterium]
MNSIDWIALISIFASLLIIAFLSGLEIAFVSSNKLSIELNKKKGIAAGKTWSAFAEHPARFIGTVLVGVNIVLVIYGLLIGNELLPIWNWIEAHLPHWAANYVKYIQLLVETCLSTLIILIVKFTSRAFFRAKNNSIIGSDFISYIATFFYWLLSSVANMFVAISEWILKYVFNVKLNKKKEVFSKMDLEQFILQSKTNDEEEASEINKELFENALALSDVKLRECLIPRKEIEGIDISTPIESIKAKFIESKLSKLLVYEKNIDNILGYVHHLDMFKNPSTLKEALHPIPTVPESMSATDLMSKFSKERKTIAWVIDEFGGTAGIVTMEDLLEEIFGEIEDEYDVAESLVDKQIASNEYIFSGRIELDFITEKYNLRFSGNEGAETLSGYIIQNNQSIPKHKERIIIGNYEFDVLNVSNTRIETVKVKVLK